MRTTSKLLCGLVLATALGMTAAEAFEDAKFPPWQGQWKRLGDSRWDISKPKRAQEPPLTPEYELRLKANWADMDTGGQGNNFMSRCIPPGMPRMALGYNPIELLMFPDMTYVVYEHFGQIRRIYTDGRSWPENFKPTYSGYSIGQWVDENGDGRYDALRVETRFLKGPRSFDDNGLPLHDDNKTVVKEYIHIDTADPEILRNEVTTIDNALTTPWTVVRSFRRQKSPAVWIEHPCELNQHAFIGGENYFLSAAGYLMPARKGQQAPDLRFFDKK